jgi:hypothetical protein
MGVWSEHCEYNATWLEVATGNGLVQPVNPHWNIIGLFFVTGIDSSTHVSLNPKEMQVF